MLSGMGELEHRAVVATANYLARAGFTDVELADAELVEPGFALTAADGGERVAVVVTVTERTGGFARFEGFAVPPGFDRIDAVSLLPLGADRALLRHHRALFRRRAESG